MPKHEVDSLPTLSEIRQSLPSHCFESNVLTSLRYVVQDLFMFGVGLYAMHYAYNNALLLFCALYPMYAFAQGTVMMGMFVLGHDAGHGSFSTNRRINYAVGVLLHSLIFTPYTPWQVTHAHHHANTGHIDRDEIFKPLRENVATGKFFKVRNFADLGFLYGGAWWAYLFLGSAPNRAFFYHYNPFSALLNPKFWGVVGSICGLAATAVSLWMWSQWTSLLEVFLIYVIPLNVFALWLVLITFLHHNDEGKVQWYSGDKWSRVAGSLSSVDRSYGDVINYLIHDIGTHQIHHLFPSIPHYHLIEATRAFKDKFPELSHECAENPWRSFHRNLRNYLRVHIVANDADTVTI